MTQRARLGRILTVLGLGVATLIVVYPVLYAFLAAFTTEDRLLETVFLPIPNTLNLPIFTRLLTFPEVQHAYLVTLARCAFYVTLAVIVGLIGGYIFSKLRFRGRDKLFLLFLSGMVMPPIVMILPMFIMMARIPGVGGNNLFGQGGHGLIREWPILFVFGWVSPFAIFLLKQSFDMVPNEYEDAAKIDGAGLWAILSQVYWPLVKPAVVALVVITFLATWNDYLWPSVTISANAPYVPITMLFTDAFADLGGPFGGAASPFAFIGVLLALWPPALVYLLLQRYFVQGLVASGLKG
jgi:multiple sugar transport system permease protein